MHKIKINVRMVILLNQHVGAEGKVTLQFASLL